ncbi:hypothetical protein MMC24_002832 [Lignoscripta atroalba]|nr:hypothetical protein [Lignoscripta atroalba]
MADKGKWIGEERLRWARRFNVPMDEKMPDGFPVSTLATQRAVAALSLVSPEKVLDTVTALYNTFFVERKPIHTPEGILAVLEKTIGGAEAKAVLEKSTTEEAKKLLSDNTEQALAEGAFGLPWIVATNAQGKKQGFWGFDHLGQVIDHLEIQHPQGETSRERGWRVML